MIQEGYCDVVMVTLKISILSLILYSSRCLVYISSNNNFFQKGKNYRCNISLYSTCIFILTEPTSHILYKFTLHLPLTWQLYQTSILYKMLNIFIKSEIKIILLEILHQYIIHKMLQHNMICSLAISEIK